MIYFYKCCNISWLPPHWCSKFLMNGISIDDFWPPPPPPPRQTKQLNTCSDFQNLSHLFRLRLQILCAFPLFIYVSFQIIHQSKWWNSRIRFSWFAFELKSWFRYWAIQALNWTPCDVCQYNNNNCSIFIVLFRVFVLFRALKECLKFADRNTAAHTLNNNSLE